jgi:hypothetical protein
MPDCCHGEESMSNLSTTLLACATWHNKLWEHAHKMILRGLFHPVQPGSCCPSRSHSAKRPFTGPLFDEPDSWHPQYDGPAANQSEACSGPFRGHQDLPSSQSAWSHAQRTGSVYKRGCWSIKHSIRDASLSYASKGITIASKISTDRPGSDPASRPLIHPWSLHRVREFRDSSPCPCSVESSLFLRVPWSLHRIRKFRDSSSCPRVQWTNTDRTFCVCDIESERTRGV